MQKNKEVVSALLTLAAQVRTQTAILATVQANGTIEDSWIREEMEKAQNEIFDVYVNFANSNI